MNQKEDKQTIEKRKEKFFKILKEKKDWLIYIVLAFIIWFGYQIRIKNLGLLKDITTGQYIPADPDAMGILRYVLYIIEHGEMMSIDILRYFPLGFEHVEEFNLLSNFIVYLYKIIHFFISSVDIKLIDIIYPAITFIGIIIIFFLLVKKLFDYKIALLSSAFLAVIPPFLFRTMTGISDKEPLGTLLFFISFYFFISSWKDKNLTKCIIYGGLSGIFAGLMGAVWGAINFIFLIIGASVLILIFLDKFTKKDIFSYIVWLIFMLITLKLFYPAKFNLVGLMISINTGILFLALIILIIKFVLFDCDLIKIKEKIEHKIPLSIASLGISVFLVILILIIFYGPNIIIDRLSSLYISLTKPFGTNRWVLTVAEAHQPYIKDWISDFGKNYFWAFLLGSIFIIYDMIKPVKRIKWKFTIISAIFLICFIFNRYSASSTFNGVSGLSQFIYIGSLIAFASIIIYYYIHYFYKDKETFEEISKIDKTYIFVLMWFFFMLIGARSAIRLLFIFAPITAILVSYFVFRVVDYFKGTIKNRNFRLITYVLIALIVLLSLNGFAKTVSNQAQYVGLNYNQQWQYAGQWIRENTSRDAVFAHWWDYGYLVQYGGERATITDGGNAIGPWNYFMGRHVLTGQNETEALEFLKAHDATHLLIISDEIGKYPAFSSIGSNEYYDRYSWINTYVLDEENIQETRTETIFPYMGGFALDEDFVYQGKLYPKGAAGIGAILVPMELEQTNSSQTIKTINKPSAILVYNGQQAKIGLNCVYFNKQKYTFEGEGFNGCLVIIPKIDNNQINPLGAALYLSDRVARTMFAHLYIYGEESNSFKIAYNDEASMPLAYYNGRLIGPLKIWDITYPSNIKDNPVYRGLEYPNPLVTIV